MSNESQTALIKGGTSGIGPATANKLAQLASMSLSSVGMLGSVRRRRLHVEHVSHRDDLLERMLSEPKRKIGFYLDSGWPGDNYEATVAMALVLVSRGWRYGRDLLYLCFPHAPMSSCRCSCSPAWSRAPRAAKTRCCKIRPNS